VFSPIKSGRVWRLPWQSVRDMVTIRNSQADRFVAKPDRPFCVCLIFGSDPGLVSERARKLAHASVDDPKDPFQLIRLDNDCLAGDPVRLVDEANTMPLFGGRRAIWVEAGTKAFVAAVETILASPPSGCSLIIEAGNLKRDSALRRIIERSALAIAVECFPDDSSGVAELIERELESAGMTITAEAKQALTASLGLDRLSSRSELHKLVLYAYGSSQIILDDVETIVADASAVSMDAAVDRAFAGDFEAIDATLARVYSEGGDPGQLLSAASRHAILLHRARLELDRGKTVQQSIEAIGPRIFFKRKQALERQVRTWNEARLSRVIALLAEAAVRARRDSRLAETIASRALWSVAQAGGHR
jgi:DNA polymerase-3 subunit delta